MNAKGFIILDILECIVLGYCGNNTPKGIELELVASLS
jgi:hypothetical protein